MSRLELESVTKVYDDARGTERAVDEISLTVEDGEFMVFVGPSGCGKSTTLRMIAGLESVTEGRIRLDGREIQSLPPSRRSVAMVFQELALYPRMTVRENMGYGLKHSTNLPADERRERVEDTAALLNIEELLDNYPSQISGGQQQRVALGRAIVREPDVFLMDEPLSNLDAKLRNQMRSELQRIQNELGTTTIYVTHNQKEAMTMGDRIAVLDDGVLQQAGTPADAYNQPDNEFVGSFLGNPEMNVFDAHLRSAGDEVSFTLGDRELASVPADEVPEVADGDIVRFGIRPEHVQVAETPAGGDLDGTLEVVEYQGNEHYLLITLEDLELDARVSTALDVTAGDRVGITFPPSRIHLFDRDSGEAIRTGERTTGRIEP